MHAYFTNDNPAQVGVTHESLPQPIFFATREAAQVIHRTTPPHSMLSGAAKAAIDLFDSASPALEGEKMEPELREPGAQDANPSLGSIIITVGGRVYLAFPVDGLAES